MQASMDIYQDRFVAFLDIMGFKNYVYTTLDKNENLNMIHKVLSYIEAERQRNENIDDTFSLKDLGFEISFFSDSIVMSWSLDYKGNLFNLLLDIIHYQIPLANCGFFLRGGIAYGKLYHSGQVVFGPALIEAYQLESQIAHYPRVIFNQEIIRPALDTTPPQNTPKDELDYIHNLIKETEMDGFYYVDFISQRGEFDFQEEYLEFLKHIKGCIEKELLTNLKRPDILQKYAWLKTYYISVINQLSSIERDTYNLGF